ncbi:Oligopeptide transport ATP-binding protein OppD [uncultured spirochete]|jgi:peptide/nickel transport system ATP-binding protein|uniref:Oligopeptide transport ATP-binding protein OppD n=1 Tax=uncultured spirochete TaxID=156406 RepID=A0A3P3XKU5_9SPIR|nr:ABC transporter ATP-binding protein [Rectinema subterraneum]SLM14426.1 Oligopeptide transport ATP-binding protein OppD [uncultured spirochete]
MHADAILELRNLKAGYATNAGFVRAVDDVSLTLHRGEFLGIAGESGCGKSTLAYSIMRLLRDNARIESGSIIFDGTDITSLDEKAMNEYRWTRMAMVFQSAMNALNPVLSVEEQLVDAVLAHKQVTRADAKKTAMEMLELVDINAERIASYPHQLSGGMRQRVMIAMALLLKPDLLIMDEPTTALDVVVQRSILQKIEELRHIFGFSVIFITHDLSLLVEISDSLAIMYAGKICEYGPSREVYASPDHPYTKGLMNAFPTLTGPISRMGGIEGQAPSLLSPPPGCRFAPRCNVAIDACTKEVPLLQVTSPGRLCACRLCGGNHE